MQVSFITYSATEFSPRRNRRLYLHLPAYFISLQVRKVKNGQGSINYIILYYIILYYIILYYIILYYILSIYTRYPEIKDTKFINMYNIFN